MRPRSVELIAAATGAEVHLGAGASATDLVGPDVVRDSREVTAGSLFLALPGERVDGHDYVPGAIRDGARAVLASRLTDQDATTLLVDDVTTALGRLARTIVDETTGLTVVAITGSSGKTSTKDLIAQVLESAGPTVSPVGSQNNELGVPLTATRVAADTQFLISEMGARGTGHIDYLCQITPPHIGVVLNVGNAHVGEFGSQEGIALAKGELVAGVRDDGWAVLNHDDALVAAMADRRGSGVRIAWTSVGAPGPDDAALRVWADQINAQPDGGYEFRLNVDDGATQGHQIVRLGLVGRHHVANALSAAAVGFIAGLPPTAIATALSAARPRSAWRMEVHTRPDNVLVINDAYNANPDSMAAAIEATAELAGARPNTRVWAVVGDMLELGDQTDSAHQAVGVAVAEHGFDQLVAVGQNADAVCRGAQQAGMQAGVHAIADPDDVVGWLLPQVRGGDTVLVKASRGLALERVALALLAEEDSDRGTG